MSILYNKFVFPVQFVQHCTLWGAGPGPRTYRALLRPAMLVCPAMHPRARRRTIVKHIAFIAAGYAGRAVQRRRAGDRRSAPGGSPRPVPARARVAAAAAGEGGYLLLRRASRAVGGVGCGGECPEGGDPLVGVFCLVVALDELLHPAVHLDRNNAHHGCAALAFAPPANRRVQGVPGFKLPAEGDSPVLVARMLQSLQCTLVEVAVPELACHLVALVTVLEHCGVDQPLEVRNSFSADEKDIGSKHLLFENGLDVALSSGSEVAHSFTPAEDEVVCCCKQLVEGAFVSFLGVKWRNTQIVALVLAQFPMTQVACQQRIVSWRLPA